ncbi:MAG: phasin family protein [Rhodospirillum sp.]|nr:phasin family protein [Rhodospirillum sp.]MCF8491832.1 phasin family protein [Rhodospirillum sp.]MCF8503209.1 phasin family protein [Rhodospirillum sp.]
MAKQPENFFDFDFSKYLTDMKVPGIDVDTIVASQRRNLEALTSANKLAVEGMQAIMKRQAEILRQSMEEAATVAQDLTGPDAPQDKFGKQTELVKDSFEKTIANMRELAEMMAKSNTEVFELLNGRISAAMEEAKTLMEKQQDSVKAATPKAPASK